LPILYIPEGETLTALLKRNRILFSCLLLQAAVLASALTYVRFGTGALTGAPAFADRMSDFPKVILWAWERPEDLSFINPREVAVAFLARTLYMRDEKAVVRPRLQPLSVAQGTNLIAVVRIESDRARRPSLSLEQRARVVSAIAEVARGGTVSAIQIDFDARLSERDFYRDLLFDLRSELPPATRLSITALASWCIHDDWLAGLPIDEAVPMLFRLGVDHDQVVEHLKTGGDFRPTPCRYSLGVSTDEPLSRLPSGRRVYAFNPRAWSQEDVRNIVREVNRWQ
jgi:Protein of unknown function (DUF3142)